MSKMTSVQMTTGGMYAPSAEQAARHAKDGKDSGKRSTVFAGDMNLRSDSILARKQKAQREALKIVSKAFSDDLETDKQQEERLKNIEELKNKNLEGQSQLKDIEDMQGALMEEYGITEDSQEYEDLQFMRKVKDAMKGVGDTELSKEDLTRYSELQKQGITEYQERALSLDREAESIQSQMQKNRNEIGMEEDAYHDVKMERLGKAPMAGAKEDAEKIMEAAGKDIIGELFKEAKDHIDEKTEEEQEKQKEKAEEKKEEEKEKAIREAEELERKMLMEQAMKSSDSAKVQAAKARAQSQSVQEVIDGQAIDRISTNVDKTAELDKELREIMDKMRLLQEDIKGAAVDDMV